MFLYKEPFVSNGFLFMNAMDSRTASGAWES